MTTQEKNKAIAEWLGLEVNELHIGIISAGKWHKHTAGETFVTEFNKWQPDKDRNQQKLIEDRLIEMKYWIDYNYSPETKLHEFVLWSGIDSDDEIIEDSFDRDTAFIDVIIKLIRSK